MRAETDQLLDTAQAAHYLNYSMSSLESWRVDGKGPVYHKTNGRLRYRMSDLDAWLDAGRVQTRG